MALIVSLRQEYQMEWARLMAPENETPREIFSVGRAP
jgi:hypothetical protein